MATQRGSVLLYTIILLAVILPTGLAIANIVRTSTRTGSYVQQGIGAHYAAESGVEQALYQMRKTTTRMSDINASTSPADWFVATPSSWALNVQASAPNNTINQLDVGDTATVDVFDFDNPFPNTPYATSLNVTWTGPTGGEFLEVTWAGWDQRGNMNPTQQRVISHSEAGGAVIDLTQMTQGQSTSPSAGFRVVIKNVSLLSTDIVQNMVVTAWVNGGAVPLPMPVQLSAVGRFGSSQQVVKATFPRRSPLQSMFDYVIFSECTLDKGTDTMECPTS